MIPLCTPSLEGNEALYLQQCIETTYVSSVGPFVNRIEAMVAEATGTASAIATSSGTTGLHVALTAVGVEPGDLVILPAFTFIASANAIAHCGAQPWLMDIDPASWTMDTQLLARCLEKETERRDGMVIHRASGRRVAAVLPVYTLGMPADMDAVVTIARAHHLPVVADAAAALGATYRGRPIGQLGADLSVISFNGNKTITAGGGGAVVGEDMDLIALVRHLSTTARTGEEYDHDRVGFNYRMTNLQAAVGCAQMERMDALVAAKRRIHETYQTAFAGLAGTTLFPRPNWADSSCWFSGLVLSPPAPLVAEMKLQLRTVGIEARSFWKPVHLQRPYQDCPRTPMPVSEAVWTKVLTLPCSSHLSASDQGEVIAAVRKLVG